MNARTTVPPATTSTFYPMTVESSGTTTLASDALLASPQTAHRRAWDKLIRSIHEMRHLGKDWDGAGGNGPSDCVVDWAVTFSQRLRDAGSPPPSRVVPGVCGNVVLEWQAEDRHVEFDLSEPNVVELFANMAGSKPIHAEIKLPTYQPQAFCFSYPSHQGNVIYIPSQTNSLFSLLPSR